MMPYRRVRTSQPQGSVGIDWSNPLTRGLAACFVGPSGFELVARRSFLKNGSPKASPKSSGLTIETTTAGASYDGYYAPEQTSGSASDRLYNPISPPITLFIVGNARSGTNNGAGIFRTNGSGGAAFHIAFWDGTFAGASFSLKTSGGNISSTTPSTNKKVVNGQNIAVLSIGVTTTTVFCSNGQQESYSTPSGNFYYEYSDIYRCFGYGGSFVGAGGNIALAGMIVGREFSIAEAKAFIQNPWQIFKPRTFFLGSLTSPQLLYPTGDVAGGTWLPSTGTDLFACIDETVASDADYIYTTVPGSYQEFSFADGGAVDPSTGGHVRYRLPAGTGTIVAVLKQGSTTLQTLGTHTLTGSAQDIDVTITASVANSTDLRVGFTASA